MKSPPEFFIPIFRPVEWWEFWNPGSGLPGGLILGLIVGVLVVLMIKTGSRK